MCRKIVYQAWLQDLKTIKDKAEEIAAQGFTSVQTSPLQPIKEPLHSNLDNSWAIYQPIGYSIGNDLGTLEELNELAAECHKYGLELIVDVVFRHLANNRGNDVSDLIPNKYRHYYKESFVNIVNYWDEYECTHGSLDGLPALDLTNKEIQADQFGMLEQLKEAGVDGVRVDAYKHMIKEYRIALADKLEELDILESSYGEMIYSGREMQERYCEMPLLVNLDVRTSNSYIGVISHDDFRGNNPYLVRDWNIFFAEYGYLMDNDLKPNLVYFARPDDNMWKTENIRNINGRK